MNPLTARLAKLESKNPAAEEYRPWVQAVGDDRDHDALYRLLADEGYDTSAGSKDNFIIRWIVSPASDAPSGNTDSGGNQRLG